MPLINRSPSQYVLPGAMADKPTQEAPRPRGLLGRVLNSDHPIRSLLMGSQWEEQQRQHPIQDQEMQLNKLQIGSAMEAQQEAQRQRAQQAQVQQMIEQYIQSQPIAQQPQLRVAAQLNPEAFAQSLMRQAPQFQHFYGRAGRINPDGTVTLGGAIPEAPQNSLFPPGTGMIFTPNPAGVPAGVPPPPDGFQLDQDQ